MSKRKRRLDPLQAKLLQGKGAEDRRTGGHGMDGGADVVDESGQGEGGGAGATSDSRFCFQNSDAPAGARQHNGGGQTVRASANHHRLARSLSAAHGRSPRVR